MVDYIKAAKTLAWLDRQIQGSADQLKTAAMPFGIRVCRL